MRHALHLLGLGSLTATSIVPLLLATAMAQPPEPPPGRPLPPHGDPLRRALDTNGDHELDADEISKAAEALAKLDANGDGRVTRDELFPRPPAGAPGRGPGVPPPPRDGEGFRPPPGPDPERFVERAMSFDGDGDGKLDRAELGTFAEEMMGRMRPRGPEGFRRDPPPRPARGTGDAGPERPERPRRPEAAGGRERPRRPFGDDDRPSPPPEGERDEA